MATTNIPSPCRITNIDPNDVMILPHDANLRRMEFSETTAIAGCYRRDEAHDPETFTAGLAVVLADYPAAIVEYAVDPRTGVVSKFPMGLPNVGQIKEYCDGILARQERIAHYASLGPSKRYEPPPVKTGQITYKEFLEKAAKGETKPRPIGYFER